MLIQQKLINIKNLRTEKKDTYKIFNEDLEIIKSEINAFLENIYIPLCTDHKFGKTYLFQENNDIKSYYHDIIEQLNLGKIEDALSNANKLAILIIPNIKYNLFCNNQELVNLIFDSPIISGVLVNMTEEEFLKSETRMLEMPSLQTSIQNEESEPEKVNSGDDEEKEKQHTEHNEESEPENVNSGDKGEKEDQQLIKNEDSNFEKVNPSESPKQNEQSELGNANSGDYEEKEKQHTGHNEKSEPENIDSSDKGKKKELTQPPQKPTPLSQIPIKSVPSKPENVNSSDKGKKKEFTQTLPKPTPSPQIYTKGLLSPRIPTKSVPSEPENVDSSDKGEKKNVSSSRFSWKVMFSAITLVFATLSIGIFFRKNIYNAISTILNNSQWLPNSMKPDVTPNVGNVPKSSITRF